MPKFFCDYCDVYLTHDSMSVRKAHNSGRNHLRNVVDYYQQIGHEKAQSVIDSITNSYAAEGQSVPTSMGLGVPSGFSQGYPHPQGLPGFPPAPGAMPPNLPPMPPGLPPLPAGRGMPPIPAGFPPLPQGFPPGFTPPGMPPMPSGMPPFPPAGAPGHAGSPPNKLPFAPPNGFPPQPFPGSSGPSPSPANRGPVGQSASPSSGLHQTGTQPPPVSR